MRFLVQLCSFPDNGYCGLNERARNLKKTPVRSTKSGFRQDFPEAATSTALRLQTPSNGHYLLGNSQGLFLAIAAPKKFSRKLMVNARQPFSDKSDPPFRMISGKAVGVI